MSKFTMHDWLTSSLEIAANSQRQRNVADSVRQDTQSLAEKTTEELQKTARGVENQFSLRMDEVQTQRQYIQRTFDNVLAEISSANNYKELLEKELLAKDLPLENANECLRLREDRVGIDLVSDTVEHELDKEVALIVEIKNILKSKIAETNEQIRLLRAVNYQLDVDLKDKTSAFQIDTSASNLNTTSKTLTFHQNSTRVPSTSVLPPDWKQFTSSNISRAQSELAKSVALRENIDATLKDSNNRLQNQGNTVDGAFNVRIAQYNDALTSNKQNLAKTQTSIKAQEKLIKSIEDLIKERQLPLQLAQTRLEQRTARPNVELVLDPVQTSLTGEVGQITQTQEQLEAKLNEAGASLRSLNRAEAALIEDINTKSNSLSIDTRCMLIRQQYKYRNV